MSHLLLRVRNVGLGITSCTALLILALAVSTLTVTGTLDYFTFSALSIATAVLHLVSVCSMIVAGLWHSGAFTSRVSFEVGWLSYLSVMWLATGAETAVTFGGIACYEAHGFCIATLMIAVVSFFNLMILLVCVITLIVAAIQAGKAGKNIWLTDVREVRWPLKSTSWEENNVNPPNPAVTLYPPGSNPGYGAPPSVVPKS